MKRVFLFTALIALVLGSCGKYEDGPGFSLRSKKARLVNNWEIDKAELDGQDITSLVAGTELEIESDGSYTFSAPDGEIYTRGDWEFSDNKEEIEFDPEDGEDFEMKIIRLANDELFVEQEDDGDLYYYEFN